MSSTPIYYARIIMIAFRPESADSVVEIYRETSAPMVLGDPGLVALLGLVDRTTGRACSITVWETLADRERSGVTAPGAQDNLARYASLMTGSYVRDTYDVTFYALRVAGRLDPDTLALARVTTEGIHPDRWGQGTVALHTFARHSNAEHPDYHGAMVFENRGRGRALLIEVAGTEAVFAANAERIRAHDLEARSAGYLTQRPEREVYEVIVLSVV